MADLHADDIVTPERFARIRGIFEGALDRPVQERRAYIEEACADDRALFGEVMAMLATEETSSPSLEGAPSTSPDEGRFPAGMVLAGRYRVLGLLGAGGMGEVYRAYDLILNQTVALKFLSARHIGESALLRFRNEVRIARQVSHPNVCRVYDLGMVDGRHFLSMEYVDGEDLASLLRRIGRLPQDKAIEFTRKICAGLSAAHERGVVHRDLKPANVMIDGRGQPRITDFGIAALAQEIPLSDLRSGTPAYMSPEQKAGKDVTTRSDLYSLGLVLHEMFTGRPSNASSSTPSELVKDLDPAVERLILRCLNEDPARRPSTALAVAMALPGGDPIAVALAAGDTPSPEMVAASQELEGLSPRAAAGCLALVVVASIAAAFFSFNSRLLRTAPLDIPADGLAFHARDILQQLGYTAAPADRAFGFDCCDFGSLRYANALGEPRRTTVLASQQPPVIRFWYREHRDRLAAEASWGHGKPQRLDWAIAGIGYDSPPNTEPGMVRVMLDATGRLVELGAQPDGQPSPGTNETFDWSRLISAAGLDPSRLEPAIPRELPRVPFDARVAWRGTYASGRSEPIRVEAAAWNGRPVHFSVVMDRPPTSPNVPASPTWLRVILIAFVVFTGAAAGTIAVYNLRMGRGDRKGATLIAVIVAVSIMSAWLFAERHVAGSWELALLASEIGEACVFAGLLWLGYLAVEPYVRRHWPESLISWTRAQNGRFRDPLVASHVLAGITAWMAMDLIMSPLWRLRPVWRPEQLLPLDGIGHLAAFLALAPARMMFLAVSYFLIAVALRYVARRRMWLADVLACAVFAFTGPLDVSSWAAFALSALIVVPNIYVTIPWLMRRFGLLAMLSAWFVRFLLAPMVFGSWYSGRGVFILSIPVAVAAWAFWIIATSRPVGSSGQQLTWDRVG